MGRPRTLMVYKSKYSESSGEDSPFGYVQYYFDSDPVTTWNLLHSFKFGSEWIIKGLNPSLISNSSSFLISSSVSNLASEREKVEVRLKRRRADQRSNRE